MKLLLSFLMLFPVLADAKPVNLILIRHAEKLEGGADPDLSAAGQDRANALTQLTLIFDIGGIYTSSAKRTIQTATPLATSLGVSIDSSISPLDYKAILDDVSSKHSGRTVVIVGHGNTVPGLINFALNETRYADLDETDFSNLFLLQYDPDNGSSALRYRYSSRAGRLVIEPYCAAGTLCSSHETVP